MDKKSTLKVSLKELIIYLVLFNCLFVSSLVLRGYFIHSGDDPFYWAVGFNFDRYFFSYYYEFMKKGFIGTIFHFLEISPTHRLVYLISLINANFFLILYIFYVKKMMPFIPQRQFYLYLLFFILSPGVAIQFGYSAGLFDNFVILITLIALFVLVAKYKFSYFVLPILLAMGLLIHEGFLFFNIPVILAVILNEVRKGNYKFHLFLVTSSTIIITLFFLFIYGSEISDDSLYSIMEIINRAEERTISDFHSPRTNHDTYNFILGSISTQTYFLKITLHTWSLYAHWQTWLGILVSLIILGIYLKPYLKAFKENMSVIYIRMVLFSPFAIFPLFLLVNDFYRWFGHILINMFLVYPYLIGEFNIIDLYKYFNRPEKVFVKTGFILFILGPIGVATALPYLDALLKKVFDISLFVVFPL
jgi:hypothetical protein